ncbi:unnamed protein product [Cyprideis torosa]|uniref:Arginine biosynthesis bifunctional protein ArgJ, mitochondrial n=1 Tax=Cyprideis torosa TaxID=163714 RepID=A0A7R8ZX54_9CRUS|nr:unnamed protein product [Cyprideis torosa]CAG0906220.1 unnamed protein product [Cyprideis torosa]
MPVGLTAPEHLTPIAGIRLATAAAGVRYADRKDVVLIELAVGSQCAATFTRNAFCAAPVTIARKHLGEEHTRYLLINSGNANAGTGQKGLEAALSTCAAVGATTGAATSAVLPFSTGVIGQLLPAAKINAVLPVLVANLQEDSWLAAANAIMTTDTLPKGISVQVEIGGQAVQITGISKGSGMIRPDMATMLAYVATDADIDAVILQQLLTDSVERSFNSITVDGDTSTNDACVLMATGKSRVHISKGEPLDIFRRALDKVMVGLAQAIIRDGEGATKFITLRVSNAGSVEEAREVAFTVAHSPLVKTALFASDANWGRILAAIGRAPVKNLDVSRVDIAVGGVSIVESGEPAPTYAEELGAAAFAKTDIDIHITLNCGVSEAVVWTTDLSHDYVSINADYRS